MANPTIREIVEAYLQDAEHFRKIVDVLGVKTHLKPILAEFGPLPFSEFKDGRNSRLRAYVAKRREAGRKDSTIRAEICKLQSALNFSAREEMIDAAPKLLRPQAGEPRSRVLSRGEDGGELGRLMAEIDKPGIAPHVRLTVLLALLTGQRKGAIFALKWEHVDFDDGVIRFSRTTERVTKKKRVDQPMHDELRRLLLEARERATCAYVVEFRGKPVKTIRTAYSALLARASIVGLTQHDLRRSAAQIVRDETESLDAAATFIGDTLATTGRHYARPNPRANLGAMDKIHEAIQRARSDR